MLPAQRMLPVQHGLAAGRAQGIGGMRSSHAGGGAAAIAESRKARFAAFYAANAPVF
jgi:hypothetical protein